MKISIWKGNIRYWEGNKNSAQRYRIPEVKKALWEIRTSGCWGYCDLRCKGRFKVNIWKTSYEEKGPWHICPWRQCLPRIHPKLGTMFTHHLSLMQVSAHSWALTVTKTERHLRSLYSTGTSTFKLSSHASCTFSLWRGSPSIFR